jgi:hypothetical protein
LALELRAFILYHKQFSEIYGLEEDNNSLSDLRMLKKKKKGSGDGGGGTFVPA